MSWNLLNFLKGFLRLIEFFQEIEWSFLCYLIREIIAYLKILIQFHQEYFGIFTREEKKESNLGWSGFNAWIVKEEKQVEKLDVWLFLIDSFTNQNFWDPNFPQIKFIEFRFALMIFDDVYPQKFQVINLQK